MMNGEQTWPSTGNKNGLQILSLEHCIKRRSTACKLHWAIISEHWGVSGNEHEFFRLVHPAQITVFPAANAVTM